MQDLHIVKQRKPNQVCRSDSESRVQVHSLDGKLGNIYGQGTDVFKGKRPGSFMASFT